MFLLNYYTRDHIHYYTKNQQDASLAVLFISNCKITLHVSDAFCVHHQDFQGRLPSQPTLNVLMDIYHPDP